MKYRDLPEDIKKRRLHTGAVVECDGLNITISRHQGGRLHEISFDDADLIGLENYIAEWKKLKRDQKRKVEV